LRITNFQSNLLSERGLADARRKHFDQGPSLQMTWSLRLDGWQVLSTRK
jgi:hypothetical protein